jgi:hypothetical protein
MKADCISNVCDALARGDVLEATTIAQTHYPFVPHIKASRNYTEYQSMKVFLRDGFIDRYSGNRLVFPATLHILGQLLPDSFPMHPNWKMSESHIL